MTAIEAVVFFGSGAAMASSVFSFLSVRKNARRCIEIWEQNAVMCDELAAKIDALGVDNLYLSMAKTYRTDAETLRKKWRL